MNVWHIRIVFILLTASVLLYTFVVSPSKAYEYNETDLTTYQQMPYIEPYNQPMTFTVLNGSGTLNSGYIQTYTHVYSLDIIIQELTAIMITVFIMACFLFFYVVLYVYRYVTKG